MCCRVAGVWGRRRVDGVIWCLGASGGEVEAGGAAALAAVSWDLLDAEIALVAGNVDHFERRRRRRLGGRLGGLRAQNSPRRTHGALRCNQAGRAGQAECYNYPLHHFGVLRWFVAANTASSWTSSQRDFVSGFIDFKMLPFLTRGLL